MILFGLEAHLLPRPQILAKSTILESLGSCGRAPSLVPESWVAFVESAVELSLLTPASSTPCAMHNNSSCICSLVVRIGISIYCKVEGGLLHPIRIHISITKNGISGGVVAAIVGSRNLTDYVPNSRVHLDHDHALQYIKRSSTRVEVQV